MNKGKLLFSSRTSRTEPLSWDILAPFCSYNSYSICRAAGRTKHRFTTPERMAEKKPPPLKPDEAKDGFSFVFERQSQLCLRSSEEESPGGIVFDIVAEGAGHDTVPPCRRAGSLEELPPPSPSPPPKNKTKKMSGNISSVT